MLRPGLLRAAAVSIVALAVGLGFGAGTHAHAAPSPEELEKQIEAQWELLEPVIEEYNAIRDELKANKTKADALQKRLQPLQLQVDVAMSKVRDVAVQAYKGGGMSAMNAILLGASSGQLPDQLSKLDALARKQRSQISDVAVVRDRYLTDKKALDQLIAKQTAHETELATKKTQIEGKLAELQKLRQQAYGSGRSFGDLKPVACPVEVPPGAAATAVRVACEQIGDMYLFAAEGPARFDCSGLVMYSWGAAGRSLPHNSKAQFGATSRVDRASLRSGDLVFFYGDLHHVGVYVGGGWMVHASRSGEPVAMAQIDRFRTPVGYGRVG